MSRLTPSAVTCSNSWCHPTRKSASDASRCDLDGVGPLERCAARSVASCSLRKRVNGWRGASRRRWSKTWCSCDKSTFENSRSRRRTPAATASNSEGASTPAIVKAHAVFAKSCALNVAIFLAASRAIASKSDGSEYPRLEYAHAVFARACAFNVWIFSEACKATAANKDGADTPAFAKAQTVLARARELNACIFFNASAEMASNNTGAAMPAFANAQTVVASSRGAKVSIFLADSAATFRNKSGDAIPSLAAAQTDPESPRACHAAGSSKTLEAARSAKDCARSEERPKPPRRLKQDA
mmetsp:Transcript_8053/g.27866  ORF Transcript_8053/g.27866 Transcript_8053/m.27866 type:complete len:299 (+) Transcript_8053:76-972(+)